MQFIFDLPNEQVLPIVFDIYEKVSDYVKNIDFVSLIKNVEKDENGNNIDVEENTEKNIKRMLKTMLKEHPKETAEIFDLLWVTEGEEKSPNILVSFNKMITNKGCIDFFTSLLQLVNIRS